MSGWVTTFTVTHAETLFAKLVEVIDACLAEPGHYVIVEGRSELVGYHRAERTPAAGTRWSRKTSPPSCSPRCDTRSSRHSTRS